LEIQRPVVSEEMKTFLQEGLHTYAPALVALSEFRRQIRSRLQTVLEEFSTELLEVGLSIDNLRLKAAPLEKENLTPTLWSLELENNWGGETYINYYVKCDMEKPKDKKVQVGAWVWLPIREDRNRLFGALQRKRSHSNETDLIQDRDGISRLAAYCNPDAFSSIEETFRNLITEWVELLSSVGRIRPFVLADASHARALSEIILEVGGEGGSIKLTREKDADNDWTFQLQTDESGMVDILSAEDQSGIGSFASKTKTVGTFQEALSLLDVYPSWFRLQPLFVHSDFRDLVLQEVRKRGGEAAEEGWHLESKSL
jgi:hypothetical protein